MENLLFVNIENAVEDGGLFIFGIEDSQMVTYIKGQDFCLRKYKYA